MWLIFALLAPVFFAIVHILDSYCVEDIFDRPWFGMITSSLASIIVFAPLPYILPFISWQWPTLNIILLALLAGALIQFSQGLYFQALSYCEAGIIGAYWNMIPAFIPIISFIFLKEKLPFSTYIGISILIFASSYILILDSNRQFRLKAFVLMLIACSVQAISYLILDHAYTKSTFVIIFYLMTIGLILLGIAPLALKSIRSSFYKNRMKLIPASKFFLVIEIANLIALAFAEKAIDLGNPALVAAIETTIPAFIIIISIFILGLSAEKYGDIRTRSNIQYKFFAFFIMSIGVILIS